MKSKLLILFGIIAALIIVGIVLVLPDNSVKSNSFAYTIHGDVSGAGGETKKDLFLKRTDIDEPITAHIVDLTKDLHYTDLISFWNYEIYTYENYVYVTWITSEQTWSDVFMAVSDDYGQTFDVKNVSQTKEYIDAYKVDYSKETVYVVWREEFRTEINRHLNHIYFTKSNNFGESWGQQKLINTFDKSGGSFDLEAWDDNVFIIWTQQEDSQEDNNIWLASSTDKAEYFERKPVLQGSRVDLDSYGDILFFTWVSNNYDDIWYGFTENLGETVESKVIFKRDWEISYYAPMPTPKVIADEKVTIKFIMNNEKGEETPYEIIIDYKN